MRSDQHHDSNAHHPRAGCRTGKKTCHAKDHDVVAGTLPKLDKNGQALPFFAETLTK
jgi:hypothetical protein